MTRDEFDTMMAESDFGDSDSEKVVVAALIVGPHQQKIADLTGLSLATIRPYARRLRANRIWVGDKIACENAEQGPGGIEIALWSSVAEGYLATAARR